jgi:hypothetical protein
VSESHFVIRNTVLCGMGIIVSVVIVQPIKRTKLTLITALQKYKEDEAA